MTLEEKILLLKVLCAILPYKLHCMVFKLNGDIKENDDILYGAFICGFSVGILLGRPNFLYSDWKMVFYKAFQL